MAIGTGIAVAGVWLYASQSMTGNTTDYGRNLNRNTAIFWTLIAILGEICGR